MFKAACPKSYSYAYDDATSTFTCTGADYTVTFCPSSPSQKSSRDSTPMTGGATSQEGLAGSEPGFTYPGSTTGSDPSSGSVPVTGSGGSGSGEAILADGTWLAGLAMGDSPRALCPSALITLSTLFTILSYLYL
ncbi:hypothetical protein M0R45_007314 [Rubus argutus]|uniref:Uncharacterized protein n=1 Tax=Rubus argutus TaxID=59490 RepID=A0AAW1Y1A0_RUBAR